MADTVKIVIRKDFPRPGEQDYAALRDAPTGWVADANGRQGAIDHRIRPLSQASRFIGTALTVESRPVDNLAPYTALKFARPGDVLLVATGDCETAAVLGDVLLGMARNAGIVAAVTDGLVRDIGGIDAVGIPTFARGLTPNSPHKDGPGTVGLPITLGGVTVNPGDLVVGDIDGVVIVPRNNLSNVVEALKGISEKEKSMDAAVAGGTTHPQLVDDLLDAGGVRFVE